MNVSPLESLTEARVPTIERMHAVLSLPGMRALGARPLASLVATMPALSVPARTVVGRLDSVLDHTLVVLDGELSARRPNGEPVRIGPWGSTGFLAMLARDPKGLSLEAARDSVVIALSHSDFEEIAEDTFEIFAHSLGAIAGAINLTRIHIGLDAGFGPPGRVSPMTAPTLGLAERLLVVRGIPGLGQAPLDIVAEIAKAAQVGEFAAGEQLFAQGDPANLALIVVDGLIDCANTHGQRFQFGPGDGVGITCAMAGLNRWYTATARTSCRALAVDRSVFIDLYEDHTDHAQRTLRTLAGALLGLLERVTRTDGHLIAAVT